MFHLMKPEKPCQIDKENRVVGVPAEKTRETNSERARQSFKKKKATLNLALE